MIISEKQIYMLIDIVRAYVFITDNEENEEAARILLTDIKNQQSEELKEIE
jgi:hypothetical protein